MTKVKEDLHIFILKYGRDKLESGATFDGLCEHLKNHGYDVGTERAAKYFWDNYEAFERKDIPDTSGSGSFKKGAKFSLTVEATFRLIEYEEFKSANRSSLTATRYATAALVVSIVAAGMSLYFSNKQLESSTTINSDQFERLIELKYDDSNISKTLQLIVEQQKFFYENIIENQRKPNVATEPNK